MLVACGSISCLRLLVVVMIVFEEEGFLFAVDGDVESGLDTFFIIATCADQGEHFLVFGLKDGASDFGRVQRCEGIFLFRAVGGYDDFYGFDFCASADEVFEVDSQQMVIIVVCPFEVGGGVGIEVGYVSTVGAVFWVAMAGVGIVFVFGLIVPVVMIMVVVVVVACSRFVAGCFGVIATGD